MVACPSEDDLVAHANGFELPGLEAHLDACPRCFAVIALARSLATSADEPAPPGGPLVAGTRVGRYVIDAPLGRGAMGIVYAAHDPELERRVAIKMLRTPSEAMQARLRREAQAMARLSHPNIVAVHDVGISEAGAFVAMERVDGVTLRRWLADPHTPAQIVEMFVRAGRGLAAAHRAGIVHRDFKPDNVMVDRDGNARVTDFGLAFVDGPREPDARVVGTPAYMAPEQAAGRTVDPRADVFAFAVALWEALADALPYPARPADRAAIVPPRRALPARIERALRAALTLEPAERTTSIDALLAALEPRRSGRYVVAAALAGACAAGAIGFAVTRPSPTAEPVRELVRRRVVTGAGGAAVDLAALSDDGLRAAYGDLDGRTYVVTLATGESQPLPIRGAASLAWSGDDVIASICDAGAPDCRLVRAAGAGLAELGRVPAGLLAPLGDRIAVVAADRLWLDGRTVLTWPGAHFVAVARAPDARRLALFDDTGHRVRIVDGEHELGTFEIPGRDRVDGVVWLGERIAYAVDSDKLSELYAVDVAGGVAGPPRKIQSFDVIVAPFGASRDGHRIGYLRRDQHSESYVAALRDDGLGAAMRLTTDQLDNHVFGWTPDGRGVLLQTEAEPHAIILAPADGGPAERLAEGMRPAVSGDRVLFVRSRLDGGGVRWTLHAMPFAGGAVDDVLDLGVRPATEHPSIACPAVGRRCLLTFANESVHDNFWIDLDDRTIIPADFGSGWTGRLAPDGTRYAVTLDRHHLELLHLAAHQRRFVADEACLINRLEWYADGGALLASCMAPTSSPSFLVRYDLGTGERRVLARTPLAFTRIAVSPDRTRLAYSVRDIGGALWVADGL